MALWKKKSRKRKSPPSSANTSSTAPQKQRKLFSPEVKLLSVKALEAGLPARYVYFFRTGWCQTSAIWNIAGN